MAALCLKGTKLKKLEVALFTSILGLPVIALMCFMAPFILDSINYNRFQNKLGHLYAESGHNLLEIRVCHEWKCIFEYKDNRSKYSFLIFGEDNLEARVRKLIEVSSEDSVDQKKCAYIQDGSNLCQI
jgi:hypothetical protein